MRAAWASAGSTPALVSRRASVSRGRTRRTRSSVRGVSSRVCSEAAGASEGEIASGLAVVLSEWCRLHQPDLLQADAGVPFEADILDAGSYDVSFSLPLSEPVLVSDRPGGGWLLEHPDEPAPIFADDDPLGILREIWHDGERIVPLPES